MSMVGPDILNWDEPADILKLATSSGQSFGQVDIRLVDEQGKDVPWKDSWSKPESSSDAESGEVRTRGLTIFKGYYKSPQADAETFQDGWFRTGDVALPVW